MSWEHESNWNPTRLLEVAHSVDSSTGATEVMTDAGRAYIKPLGNRQGPHVLATDWIGTLLAKWLGLSTFEVAILELEEDDRFLLPQGYAAQPGPAFAARAETGEPWGRDSEQLAAIVNPDDLSRLVVFDTWTLNCDRCDHATGGRKPNYDNVFLSSEGVEAGKRRLIAMDHGLCFIRSGEDLSHRLNRIDKIHENQLYGLFPEFRNRLRQGTIEGCAARLRAMDSSTAEAMIATIPREWDVSAAARDAWCELICRRAEFVADNIEEWIDHDAPWFGARENE